MARMFPDKPLGTTASNAERKVFYALKDLLPEEYTVLHSVPVYIKDESSGRMYNGEVDFLVIHPEKGFLVIEVKGGGISKDATNGTWSSEDAHGNIHVIKDPYEQGKKYAYAISNLLEREKTTRKYDYPFFHAVWFPDVHTNQVSLGISDNLHLLTLGKQDLDNAEAAIPRVFRNCIGGGRDVPEQDGVDAFRKFLAPSWKLSIKLSNAIEDEQRTLIEATKSQYKVLSLLQRYTRALVSGPAGSGKTYLAVEKVRRIHQQSPHAHILLTCYNSNLATRIWSMLQDVDNVEVCTFHKLCVNYCKEASIRISVPSQSHQNDYFDTELPGLLLNALCEIGARYDAIIVDEGQDFDPSWWPILEQCLNDPEKGLFYIFFDDNQGIYGKKQNYPIKQEPFVLEENCRNTKKILRLVNEYYKGVVNPVPLGPEGRDPEIYKADSPEILISTLKDIISNLIKSEKVHTEDIIVLTPNVEENSLWKSGMEVGGIRLSWDLDSVIDKTVACSTIHSFKGLERPIVILTEIDSVPLGKQSAIKYIAYSRANSHLIIISKKGSA